MTDQQNRQALIKKRDELRARLQAVRTDIAGGLDPNLDDQAVQLENAEVLDEIARVTSLELEKVEQLILEAEVQTSCFDSRGSSKHEVR